MPSVQGNAINNRVTLTHTENYITEIFSKYIIYGFEKAFPTNTSDVLKSYYTLKRHSKDLINELSVKVP
ncbi:MAG: hypothetical protein V3V28_13330 [Polaribacter sp.]|uniref:hypothetical protein n=1 Tax=Polaribacter sp. TaxID=1920175 RepID=UPI002F3531B8